MLLVSRNYDSLRILIYLCGQVGYVSTTREISEALSLSLAVCRRQVWQLRHAGLVTGARGYGGGVTLAAPPEKILIGYVVAAIEAQRLQTNDLDPECKPIFERAVGSFFTALNRMTVRDICPTCQSRIECSSHS
ncbi:Rrf2 family transcriptional regulator [uncultured Hyphomicrobium sp.]|uniref:Rrf2 family transcriptional regulator n=1 Tax=uncultured Hyphomicrobium sp. TaxID=194373 RepID=UPI003452AC32